MKRNRCSNCTKWDPTAREVEYKKSDDWGLCIESIGGKLMDAICYGEDISGELITNKDFYCISHEKRGKDFVFKGFWED